MNIWDKEDIQVIRVNGIPVFGLSQKPKPKCVWNTIAELFGCSTVLSGLMFRVNHQRLTILQRVLWEWSQFHRDNDARVHYININELLTVNCLRGGSFYRGYQSNFASSNILVLRMFLVEIHNLFPEHLYRIVQELNLDVIPTNQRGTPYYQDQGIDESYYQRYQEVYRILEPKVQQQRLGPSQGLPIGIICTINDHSVLAVLTDQHGYVFLDRFHGLPPRIVLTTDGIVDPRVYLPVGVGNVVAMAIPRVRFLELMRNDVFRRMILVVHVVDFGPFITDHGGLLDILNDPVARLVIPDVDSSRFSNFEFSQDTLMRHDIMVRHGYRVRDSYPRYGGSRDNGMVHITM
jgi:hypothetical protein